MSASRAIPTRVVCVVLFTGEFLAAQLEMVLMSCAWSLNRIQRRLPSLEWLTRKKFLLCSTVLDRDFASRAATIVTCPTGVTASG
ncbi:MAG: hypothetical protein IT486_03070 [Gammaproteobacteria bacterium]|nr:hypothetical protein [Gammaproteobacteria bacterium]